MLAALMVLLRSMITVRVSTAKLLTERGTSAAPLDGPTVLDPPRQGLAGLALRLGRRAARYRGPMAPPMASQTLDPALTTGASRPSNHEFTPTYWRATGDGEES
jgi:hypothetical protein